MTIIIPAYNEVSTIRQILDAVAGAEYPKQIIVVDDGSTDGTPEAVCNWIEANETSVELLRHPRNLGKGTAIRSGLEHARGLVTLIQDADLEYNPGDYPKLVGPILDGRAQVVYGSRYLRNDVSLPWTPNRICVYFLNFIVRILYGIRVTDEATCYKAFRTTLLRSLDLRCERFEFCPEVTAKVGRLGLTILEVPICYRPRSHGDGKKIRWYDGLEAVATLLRWRVVSFRPAVNFPRVSDPSRATEVRPASEDTEKVAIARP